jgi:hypothetical protein
MGKRQGNAGHHAFLESVRVLHRGAGAAEAAQALMDSAANAGLAGEIVEYDSLEQFYEAMELGTSPIGELEGPAKHFGDGVFGQASCPFAAALQAFTERYGRQREFDDVTAEMNRASPLTQQLHVGEGAAQNPFCVMHQPVRAAMAARVRINGRALCLYQLACKDSAGDKGIAEARLAEAGVTLELVESVLEQFNCCYCFRFCDDCG